MMRKQTKASLLSCFDQYFLLAQKTIKRKKKVNDFVLFLEPPPLCLAHRGRGKHDPLPFYLVSLFLVCHTFNWYPVSCVST